MDESVVPWFQAAAEQLLSEVSSPTEALARALAKVTGYSAVRVRALSGVIASAPRSWCSRTAVHAMLKVYCPTQQEETRPDVACSRVPMNLQSQGKAATVVKACGHVFSAAYEATPTHGWKSLRALQHRAGCVRGVQWRLFRRARC